MGIVGKKFGKLSSPAENLQGKTPLAPGADGQLAVQLQAFEHTAVEKVDESTPQGPQCSEDFDSDLFRHQLLLLVVPLIDHYPDTRRKKLRKKLKLSKRLTLLMYR